MCSSGNMNMMATQIGPTLHNHNHNRDARKIHTRKIKMENKKTVSWTSSIARHCKDGMLSKAAATEFCRMRVAGVEPNDITFLTLVSASSNSNSLPFGLSIHAYILKLGFRSHDNVKLWTALLGMYSKCSLLPLARQLFDTMSTKNAMSWNTMIDGYMRSGDFQNALHLFDQMPLPLRDKITWTALLTGFVRKRLFHEALACFTQMQLSAVEPDHVTIIALLSASANLGLLGLGMWFHHYALRLGLCQNIRVQNSLIDMYSRCGSLHFARQLFQNITNPTIVTWNSMILGLAINGHAHEALQHFTAMQHQGFQPGEISYTAALTACTHAGLLHKGLQLFNTMTKFHNISPTLEHYGCMVDLLSRAGRLQQAFTLIQTMPMNPNQVIVGCLLAACRTRGNLNLAQKLSSYLVGSDSNYVTLSNIYADMGSWDGAGKVRRTMKANGITKRPGYSAIEIDCSIHEFLSGDKSHIHTDQIYAILHHLSAEIKLYGYVSEMNVEDLSQYG